MVERDDRYTTTSGAEDQPSERRCSNDCEVLAHLARDLGDPSGSHEHFFSVQMFLDAWLAPSLREAKSMVMPTGGVLSGLAAARAAEADMNFTKSVFSALGVADLKQERAATPMATA